MYHVDPLTPCPKCGHEVAIHIEDLGGCDTDHCTCELTDVQVEQLRVATPRERARPEGLPEVQESILEYAPQG